MRTVFRYSHGFYLFSVLARILSFSDIDTDSTIFRYLFAQFFGTHTDSTFSQNSPGYYHFSVLTLILPFFRCHLVRFLVIARILHFPGVARILSFFGTDPDFTIIRYSCRQFFGTRTDSTFPRYSPGFYQFSVMTLILPFFVTRLHSFSVHTDSAFSRYSPEFYHFSILTLIPPFFGTRSHSFSVLTQILPFPSTRPDTIIFRY